MFHWTKQERQVILFLASVALLGHGIRFLKTYHGQKKIVANFFAEDLGKVNLNTASKELLMSVSGIGPVLAGRIIEYRQEKRGFGNIDELKNIKGITHYRFELIKDYLILK
jgi:competence protein ComEA